MNVFVLDTNIISYYLKGNKIVINNITQNLLFGHKITIAPIVYYEIKRGLLGVNSVRQLQEFENICRLFGVGQLDNSVLDTAAKIYVEQRKIGRMIEDADIFIAAYCLNNKYILVTNNTKHFVHIANLNITNWTNF